MAYLSQRGSWRTGGYNGAAPPDADHFKPETTTDVELGVKYNGYVVDHPARFNLALYDQRVYNAQRNIYLFDSSTGAFSFFTGNVPAAEVSGLEADAELSATSWLRVGGAASATDARYTQPHVTLVGYLPLTYGPYGSVPSWTASGFAEVAIPIASGVGKMSLRADVYAQAAYWYSNFGNTLTPQTELPGYTKLDVRFDWRRLYGSQLTLSLYAKNLNGAEYYLGGLPTGPILGLNTAVPAPPRTYGASLRYDF